MSVAPFSALDYARDGFPPNGTSKVAISCVRFTSIVWKNSQNDRSRKSRFCAPNLICAGNRHDEAHRRATRGEIAGAAEALPNFPSRPPMAVQIVIDAKNRVFPHNPPTPDGCGRRVCANTGHSPERKTGAFISARKSGTFEKSSSAVNRLFQPIA
jgi:hypothetical protein